MFGLASFVRSQTPVQPAPTFRVFCLTLNAVVSGIHYDVKGKRVTLNADNIGLSSPYPCPPDGKLSLYIELPPVAPDEKPQRVPLAEARLSGPGNWLLFLVVGTAPAPAMPPSVMAKAVQDDWGAERPDTVRLFNFCRTSLALQLGPDTFELPSGQSHVASYSNPAAATIWLKAAVQTSEGWEVRLGSPQRVPPADIRLTWVLLDNPVTPDNPLPRILLRTWVDPRPAPPQPKS